MRQRRGATRASLMSQRGCLNHTCCLRYRRGRRCLTSTYSFRSAHLPARTPRESGTYWSSTERSHVIYESRLELARLLYADFDTAVHRIVAQPFLLNATVDRRVRRHVPDFLLIDEHGLVVVDVKPRAQLGDPKVAFTLDWTRKLVEGRTCVTKCGASRQRRSSATFASSRASVTRGVSTTGSWN